METKRNLVVVMALVACALLSAEQSTAANVTGNPFSDGWTSGGNALDNGVYVRGSANYGYEVFSNATTIVAGSNLEIADLDTPANSWLAGDTVLGVGGRFADTNALDAGWGSFSGNSVNQLYTPGANLKFQVKFGATDSLFATSTVAPNAGNGLGSLGSHGGDGAVQIRTSAYFGATEWAAGSGLLNELDKPGHIARNGSATPDADVARISWVWDGTRVTSWELFLNLSLLDRLQPGDFGDITAGGLALLTVQNGDNAYTDALIGVPTLAAPVPLPGAAGLGLLGLGLVGLRRRFRKTA